MRRGSECKRALSLSYEIVYVPLGYDLLVAIATAVPMAAWRVLQAQPGGYTSRYETHLSQSETDLAHRLEGALCQLRDLAWSG